MNNKEDNFETHKLKKEVEYWKDKYFYLSLGMGYPLQELLKSELNREQLLDELNEIKSDLPRTFGLERTLRSHQREAIGWEVEIIKLKIQFDHLSEYIYSKLQGVINQS